MSSLSVGRSGLFHCSGSHQGFWSFWSHFNMTFIPRPWRVVSKAWTACSRGNRWVTRGFTFTLPDANMAMAIGQLQHKTNIWLKSSISVTPNNYKYGLIINITACKITQKWNCLQLCLKHLLIEQEGLLMGIFLRIAVAENSSDVHFSYCSIDQRNSGHFSTETHQHHHTSWTCRLTGTQSIITYCFIITIWGWR